MAFNWKIEWEKLLLELLSKHDIPHEKTSFKISSDLQKGRDFSWESTVCSGQVVSIERPKRKGANLKIKANNANSLPVIIGTIEFYDEDAEYTTGIIGQLIEKELEYSNGDTRKCLDFDQPIILIGTEEIPMEILESTTLRLRSKAKKSGCFTSITLLLSFFVFVILSIF